MELCRVCFVLMLCIFVEGQNNPAATKAAIPPTSSLPAVTNEGPVTHFTAIVSKPPTTTKITTTNAPNHTTTTTTTTAPPPITTSVKPSTTTAAPTPSDPVVGKWNVTKPGTNITCIMANMAMQIEIDYMESNVTKKVLMNIPPNATAVGNCDTKRQLLNISWTAQNYTNAVSFAFVNNTNTSKIDLDGITVNINGLKLPNATSPLTLTYGHPEFHAPLKHSYKCNKEQVLKLNSTQPKANFTSALKVSQLQIQAFRTGNSTQFDDAIDCIKSSTPDIVPIAVGCALAALVVIVLLGYLYGRRRSQARGYLSM